MEKRFVSTMRSGFYMTFANGLTASVQWGAQSYSDNRFPADMDFSYSKDARSDTAEVAVMHRGDFVYASHFLDEEDQRWSEETVGYLTPEKVVDFLVKVRDYPADKIDRKHLKIIYM